MHGKGSNAEVLITLGAYAFRCRNAPLRGFTLDGSSLSDQEAMFRVAEFMDPAAGMALQRLGDEHPRPIAGTARHPFLSV